MVYQDDRENNQIINITFINNATGEKVYETSGRSDIAGNVYFETPVLPVGVYTIDAAHYNGIPYHPNRDYYYTDIFNRTNFAVEAEGPYVDVGITKSANETQIYVGETVQWDITVKNNGDADAENVVITDILPEGLEFVSASEAGYDKVNGIWTIGTLQAGESKTLTIVTKATKPGSILNKAEVTADNDDNPDNNEANDTVKVVFVDVGVVKEANETKVTTGDLVSWTITVSNLGNGTAKDVVLTDTLPAGLEFLSAEYTVGTYADGVWTIGDLDPNQSVTIVLKTKVVSNAPVNITNVAKATTSSNDTNRDNDESNDTITVEPKMDLAISKEADTKLVYNNTEVTWTITVKNGGPSEAYDVSVSDNLPSGLKFVSSNPSKGTYDDAAGKWTIGTLAAGETVTLTITSLVRVDQFGSITNAAEVTTTSNDTNESNNKANDTIEVVDKTDEDVDLEIRKEVNQTTVRPDGHVSWTITVTNNGPNDAKDVKVKDILPAGLEQTSVTPSVGTYANGVWDIGDLANGESVTLTINTHVTATDDISITNDAEVNTTSRDTNPDNNKDNATTEVISEVDVAVEKTTPNATAKTGETVEWIITVTNKGPSTARNVRVNDVMPEGMQYVSSDAAAGTYENGVWTIGDLAVNSPVTLKIICKVTSTKEETIVNFAEVTTTSNDTNESNNRDNATVDIVQSHVDVSVEKTANATAVRPGDYVSWTVTVKNNGPDKANDVAVSDTLPAGLQFISADTAAGRYENGVWTIGDLEAGQTVTLTIVTEVSETENVNLTNIVVVTTTSNDTNESNNRANDTVEVLRVVDIAVDKAADVDKAVCGDTVTWTVTVTNNGPSKAENVVVTDVLPAGLKYMNSTSDVGSYDHATGKWTIGDLEVGQTVTLTIVTEVSETENVNLTNIVVVTTTSNDTNESNNRANDTVEVLRVVDIAVDKAADVDKAVCGDTVTWTVTVTNNGPSKAENVVVSDVLPAGLKYISGTSSVGVYDQATGKWTVGDLIAGSSAELIIVTEVTAAERVNITNAAVGETSSNDTNESNNRANDTVEVLPVVDVGVDNVADKDKVVPGDTVTWTVTVINNGPSKAENVVVTDVLPAGLKYMNSTSDVGSYDHATGKWTIGDLEVGQTVILKIVTEVTATEKTNITTVAVVNTTSNDTNESNNRANDTIEVIVEEKAADLKVVKKSDKNEYKVGETVKWTIVVNNLGPLDAINTLVHDALPNGMDYLSYSATHGTFDSSTGTWNIGTLGAGEYATLDIYSRATASGTVTNFANATTDTQETDYENNYGNRTVVVRDNSTEPIDVNNDTNRTAAAELESPAMMKTGNPIMALLMIFILPLLGIKRRKE